jgi:two-component sensor histidine kinase
MTNHFAHKQSWPEAKTRIKNNLATVQAVLLLMAKAFDCPQAADTLAAMANVNRLTTPSQ